MSREDELRKIVEAHGTWGVWHYTLAAYLPSIFKEGGILPRSELEARGVAYFDGHYWGSTGKENELADFVCCSFLPSWGMMTTESSDLALIQLDRSVIWSSGTCFCPGNVARNAFPASDIKKWTEPEHLEKLYVSAGYVTVAQAELLVGGGIPLSYFRELVFWDQSSRDDAVGQIEAVLKQPDFKHPAPNKISANVNSARFPKGWAPERVGWQEEGSE